MLGAGTSLSPVVDKHKLNAGPHDKASGPTPSGYAELHCVSNFSFLRGASHPEELVASAHALGYTALALTDECSLAGIVRAHLAAKEKGFALIVGTELTLAPDASARSASALATRLVLLATDRASYGNLSALITRGRRQALKGRYRLRRADLAGCIDGCLAILLPPARADASAAVAPDAAEGALDEQLEWLAATLPGNAWLGVELLGAAGERARLGALREAAAALGVPCVACGDVHMHDRSRRAVQDTISAIRLKCTLAEAGYRLFPNAERHLRALECLGRIYPPELLAETLVIARRCNFSLDSLRYEYPEELVPAGATPASHLRDLIARGFAQRFGAPLSRPDTNTGDVRAAAPVTLSPPAPSCREANDIDRVRELVEHELALISELGYEPYFLTVHDIVAFARGRGILCQGRGSAANSAACYCLGITEVDPMRMQMLFERFISRERDEPPDIDVDFEHQRREEVMQYVYVKYGRERAALAATLITYRPKSALRDIGKALGLELAQVDRLAKALAWWDRRDAIAERIREMGLDPDSAVMRRLVALVDTLIGFPRHLSQHVGGFVIARDRLDRMVPIENAAMPERTVIQWDKDDLDALGLLKVDCLALGMLSAIRRAIGLINERQVRQSSPEPARTLTMADIPAEDPDVYAMIRKADTIGVFQIESRAQMAMLPRLAARTFYDLVIEVAIVRPGPIQGGMIHPYLRRRQQQEAVTYPSAAVKAVLERTLGVPIFQEQVMQLAIVAAGFTPGEADRLRRSMAAWRRKGGLWQFEQRLIEGMRERGYSEQFARQIFQQILGFGEYGFPESHSASFALLVYVSAWLKCHHHDAFTCALLNSQPMGFYAPSQLVQDARRHGVGVLPVDVAMSDWDCTLESGTDHVFRSENVACPQPALRLGMRMVKGLARAAGERIVAARALGAFASVADLAERAVLDRGGLNALARAGALKSLSGHRRAAAWQVGGIERTLPLLDASTARETPVVLAAPSEGEDIAADYRSLGLSLRRHPLALLRPNLERRRLLDAAQVQRLAHGQLARTAGIVTCRQRPDTASGVIFITLEDETGTLNVVVWRNLIERQRREVLGARLLGVHGTVEREGEVVHVVAGHLLDLSPLLGSLQTASRDFH
ncbi:MAG: error-prone DNA polymerase [Burkholderiales bacterium]|nr:error-prone DNA polymerase [Burkholderiales bacterium]